uniref:Secreted protein n=1 Tax=Panagrellus redivivus TaxID=6233 RepID=A0A7E4VWG7_PANRE
MSFQTRVLAAPVQILLFLMIVFFNQQIQGDCDGIALVIAVDWESSCLSTTSPCLGFLRSMFMSTDFELMLLVFLISVILKAVDKFIEAFSATNGG